MIVSHEREKLIQAVVFFASRVRKLGKTKLFKLLYFLDFEHFRDTGRSVTGLGYSAWKMGPVPVELFEELRHPRDDWAGRVSFSERGVAKGTMLAVEARAEFDPTHFTKRELRLLEVLATEFRDVDAEDMVEATHLENMPWHRVWNEERRKQQAIPYAYALRKQDQDVLTDFAAEREELIEALSR